MHLVGFYYKNISRCCTVLWMSNEFHPLLPKGIYKLSDVWHKILCSVLIVGFILALYIIYCYELDGPGMETRRGARFSSSVQTGPWNHPFSCKLGSGYLSSGAKRPGCGVNHLLLSSAEVKERVEPYLYFPSGFSWPVLRVTLTF